MVNRAQRTGRERRKDARLRNMKGAETSQRIHETNPRSARPYSAYRAEAAKPKGERDAKTLTDLRKRFTPDAPRKKRRKDKGRKKTRGKFRKPRMVDRGRKGGNRRGRGPNAQGPKKNTRFEANRGRRTGVIGLRRN